VHVSVVCSLILEYSLIQIFRPVFAIFFTAWSSAIKRMIHPSSSSISRVHFIDTLADALVSLSHHTPAKPGDRTLMDALHPLCNSPNVSERDTPSNAEHLDGSPFSEACKRAREGALRTKGMKPKLGRAVYVELKEISELPPDPGAWGVAVLAEGFWDGFCGQGE
jgi:dihydroxyacetone kinase